MTPEQLVAFAEGLSRVAAAGGGPKAFANHLAHELNASVLIEDAEHKHLAAAGDGVSASIRDVVDPPAISPREVHLLSNGRPGVAMALYVGETHLGWLAVFGERMPEQELLLRLTASAIGLELSRDRGGQRGRLRSFWERLLTGAFPDAQSARDVAASLGITLAANYVVVALEIEIAEGATAATELADVRRIAGEAFHAATPDAGHLDGDGSLRLILPAAREVDVANIRTAATLLPRTLAKKFPEIRISGGVGQRAGMLSQSMGEATGALTIGRRMFGTGRIAVYEDLGIYPLLFETANAPAWRAFSQRTLAPLRAYDEKHQTELERTLALYFAVGENVKTAAAELNVHRHTVFYRLRQIADICRSKLENPHDQLTLRLAIAIDALFK